MDMAMPVPDLLTRLKDLLLADFALAAGEWSRSVSMLTKWEDEHLLDNSTQADLDAHKKTLQNLIAFGRFISMGTQPESFPDRKTAELVAATQTVLNDKLRMWHDSGERMTQEDSARIVAACFPE
jgi:hypothetical protein